MGVEGDGSEIRSEGSRETLNETESSQGPGRREAARMYKLTRDFFLLGCRRMFESNDKEGRWIKIKTMLF